MNCILAGREFKQLRYEILNATSGMAEGEEA